MSLRKKKKKKNWYVEGVLEYYETANWMSNDYDTWRTAVIKWLGQHHAKAKHYKRLDTIAMRRKLGVKATKR